MGIEVFVWEVCYIIIVLLYWENYKFGMNWIVDLFVFYGRLVWVCIGLVMLLCWSEVNGCWYGIVNVKFEVDIYVLSIYLVWFLIVVLIFLCFIERVY